MPLNSFKTQLYHYLRALAIYQTWRSLGITFLFKVMGFFFQTGFIWMVESDQRGEVFSLTKFIHMYFIHAHSTAQGKEIEDGLFFLLQSWEFFFSFWLMMLVCDSTLSFPLEKCSFWSQCQLFTLWKVGSQLWHYRD